MNEATAAFREFIGVVDDQAEETNKRYSMMKATVQKCTRHSRAGTHMKDT